MKKHNYSVFLKCISDINLCNHMAQWKAINKKSNFSAISYYIDIDI